MNKQRTVRELTEKLGGRERSVLDRPGRGCVLQTVYDLAAKTTVGLRFNCKIWPESDLVYDLTAIDICVAR
jgi:hypothetical protein